MSLTAFSFPIFFAGAAVLTVGLWMLHRLRVRHREVTLPTIQFWSFAAERSRARALDRRFRHPLAYLFILALLTLLWTLAGDPRREEASGREHFVVIDASAAMASGGRFTSALERAEDVLATQGGRVHIHAAGAVPLMLYRPGDSSTLFGVRSEGLTPDLCPSTIVSSLDSIRARATPTARPLVTLISAEDLDVGTSTSFDDELEIRTIVVPCAESATNRFGIIALGAAPADQSPQGVANVLVVVRRFDGVAKPPVLDVRFDGVAAAPSTITADGAATWNFEFKDGVSEGAIVRARLVEGDGFPADDAAEGRVPRSTTCSLNIVGRLPERIMAVLDADTSIIHDPSARLVLGFAEAIDESAAAALIIDADPSAPDVAIEAGDDDLEREIMDVFAVAPSAVIVRVSPGHDRVRVRLAQRSFEGDGVFSSADVSAIVLFRLVHLMGAASIAPHWIAAGRDVDARASGTASSHGRRLPIAGGHIRPLRAGHHRIDGADLNVPLLDAESSRTAGSSEGEGRIVSRGGAAHLASWFAATCALLLCLEWFLVRSGRMP